MAEEKKKKDGITFEERVRRSMGTKFGEKKAEQIIKKDKEKGNDPSRIVAYPPKRGPAPPKPKKPKQPTLTRPTKLVKKGPALGDTPKKKATPKGQVSKGAAPLEGKPRSIAEAKKRGEVYFFDSKGVKKIAATAADLKKTGLSLREYANKFAPKKQTKKQAESLKGFAAIKKRGGGVMKKKSYAGGGAMKKKGMAAGGRNTMKKQMMRGGGMGMMKKKMMAGGGAMKKKGYAKGGKVMKMRGGGLATRGTNFKIR